MAEVDEESELEEDMEGMVEGLDAGRLLDPRDLQDVLNRIPDHELTQLFDAPGGCMLVLEVNQTWFQMRNYKCSLKV